MILSILLIYLIIFLFPFGQLTKIPLPFASVSLYAHDVVIAILWLTFFVDKIVRKEKIIWPTLTRLILSFFGIATFSLLLAIPYRNINELAISSLYLLRWIGYAGIYVVLYNLLKEDVIHDLGFKIHDLMTIAFVVIAVLGIIQYIFIPDIADLQAFGWDPHYFRVVGAFLDSGFMGIILVLGLVMAVVNKRWWLFGLLYLPFVLTYSRSAYLAYMVAMIVLAAARKSVKLLLATILLLAVSLPLLPRPHGEGTKLERYSTINARFANYNQAIKIAWNRPLFGVGFNLYRYAQRDYGFISEDNWLETHAGAGADSSVLFILATTGVIGLMSYGFLLLGILRMGMDKDDKSNSKLVLLAGTTAIIINSFFNNTMYYAWIMWWWWIILALVEVKDYKKL